MPYTLTKHLNYDVWATAKLSQILENVDENILRQEAASSFPTIEKTILHIWDAQLVWLKRLQGESLTEWPSKDFAGDIEELLGGWTENAVAFRDHFENKDEAFFNEVINYNNIEGKPFSNTPDEIAYHVINHGTFHRGQIITQLRACGIGKLAETDVLSSTDLITYLRAVTA